MYSCCLMFMSFTFGYDMLHEIMHDPIHCDKNVINGCSADGLSIAMFFTALIGGIFTIFQPEMKSDV